MSHWQQGLRQDKRELKHEGQRMDGGKMCKWWWLIMLVSQTWRASHVQKNSESAHSEHSEATAHPYLTVHSIILNLVNILSENLLVKCMG